MAKYNEFKKSSNSNKSNDNILLKKHLIPASLSLIMLRCHLIKNVFYPDDEMPRHQKRLEPLATLEKEIGYGGGQDHHGYGDGIAVTPVKFRHKLKVHSVPSDDQGKRHEYGRHYGKNCHYPVLFDIYMGLIQISELHGIIPQGR